LHKEIAIGASPHVDNHSALAKQVNPISLFGKLSRAFRSMCRYP